MKNQWVVTRDLFLTADEIGRLFKLLKDAKDLALIRKRFYCHVRDFYMIHLLLETGVRCMELVALRISDFRDNSLIVRCGKGGKKRNILLTKDTIRLIREFIKIKKALGEPVGPEDFLFVSERKTQYSTRGVRARVKHWFNKAGVNSSLSVHSCRHTYISNLLAAKVNPVLVRDQAGHSNLSITSLYAHAISDLGDLQLYNNANK